MTEKLDVVVGDTLQWFTSGSRENLPLAAIVTLINHNGMLNMLVITDSGFPQHKVGVWPMGHPILKENPNLAVKSGAWDFCRPKVAVAVTAPTAVADAAPAAETTEAAPFEGGTQKPTLSKKNASASA